MNFIIHDAEQRSDAWFAARCGCLTGSRAGDMLATIKTGEAAARRDYRVELVCERLTGRPADENGFVSKDMQRGVELEASAFAAYEARTGHLVRRTGFLRHTALMAGCSVDGDVDNFVGIIELKCPRAANHLRYVSRTTIPPEHAPQVLHNAWITGAEWVDFVSYDPRFPPHLQLAILRFVPKPEDLAAYAEKAMAFLAEVDRDHAALTFADQLVASAGVK